MNTTLRQMLAATPAVVLAVLIGNVSVAGATEQAKERQDARDTRQDSRQSATVEKIDCRLENNKSNAACRQDKRETKQDGRQDARDARRGN